MQEFTTIFLALIFETTPFLLAGVLVSVLAGPLVERALSGAAMRGPVAGMLAGTSAGLVLPMCDCGSRPLAHRLALAGRREFAVAFMVAAPVINPIVVITTWLAFRDGELLALRLGVTALMALAVATAVSRLNGDIALSLESDAERHDEHMAQGWPQRVLGEFFELFQWLVLGSALAAFTQLFLDQDAFTSIGGVYVAIAGLMLLAFLLSICSSVDAFVVAGIGGLGLGPILAFLTFGPLVNLKSIPLYLKLFSVPAVLGVVLIVTQLAFASGVIVELRAW